MGKRKSAQHQNDFGRKEPPSTPPTCTGGGIGDGLLLGGREAPFKITKKWTCFHPATSSFSRHMHCSGWFCAAAIPGTSQVRTCRSECSLGWGLLLANPPAWVLLKTLCLVGCASNREPVLVTWGLSSLSKSDCTHPKDEISWTDMSDHDGKA